MDRNRKSLLKVSVYLNALLLFSVVYVALAGFSYYNQLHGGKGLDVISSLGDRNVAIQKAKEAGQDTYQFETQYIPGLGPSSAVSNSTE